MKKEVKSLKNTHESTCNVDVKTFIDGKVVLEFMSNCGKNRTYELLGHYELTVKELLSILQKTQES